MCTNLQQQSKLWFGFIQARTEGIQVLNEYRKHVWEELLASTRLGQIVLRPQFQNFGLCRPLLIINKESGLQVNTKKDFGTFLCHIVRVQDKIIIVV
jgi:hypothetical protein